MHKVAIHETVEYLTNNGFRVIDDYSIFRDMKRPRYPDVYAVTTERVMLDTGRVVKRPYRIVVEIETKNRPGEMERREIYYLDTFPKKADAMFVVKIWEIPENEQDSLRAIRRKIRECVPV